MAVWRITEPETFFTKEANISRRITHPQKRLQHLAGRYLLKFLEPDLPVNELRISESGKPLLKNGDWFISISHCASFAAVIVSRKENVGIDIEIISPKLKLISHKFLNQHEADLVHHSFDGRNELAGLTLFWSAKEAMFKWYGKGEVDFRKNLLIESLETQQKPPIVKARFQKEETQQLFLMYKFFGNLCLVWTRTAA